MDDTQTRPPVDRPWWMSAIDEPPIGGLLRTNSIPVFGLLRVSIAAGTGDISLWMLDQSALDTDTTLDF